MSIFSKVLEGAANIAKESKIAKEIAWDFEKDIPIFKGGVPATVERAEAVKVWAWKALRTERFRHEIYTWNYGCELFALVGSPFTDDLKRSEAARFVRECLTVSEFITDVKDINVDFENGRLLIDCRIETVYGNTGLEVKQIV